MEYRKVYENWLNSKFIDQKTKDELLSIKDDEKEIEDRFYKELEFGTAGLRGKIGAGTNRMNIYNIIKVTQGLANYIKEKGQEYMDRGVVIAYDCRHYSDVFSKAAALVLCANGIKVYLFESLRPTPELSFSVRKLKTCAGIVVTASHNPKEYNGYKVYWEEGSQILEDTANAITNKINSIKSFEEVKQMEEEEAIKKGILKIIGKEIDDEYIGKVKSLSLRDDIDKDINIVYTPLNGTGNIPVRRVLKERGFKNVHVVKEQENPDPDFTTVGYPNPEDTRAFKYSEKLGKEVGADLLIATDPDCDRLAIEVKNKEGEYVSFNGNQTGAILIKYLIESLNEKNQIKEGSFIVKSIVTGDLGRAIAEKYGVKVYESFTGFKNICGVENKLEKQGNNNFIFGYEESIGYLAGNFVRDKDAVISSMLLCEAAAYYKKCGKTLIDVLHDIYEEYGYYREKQISLILEGIEGQQRIKRMMEKYRDCFPRKLNNFDLVKYIDYRDKKVYDLRNSCEMETGMTSSNVLRFFFEDGSWYALRPSGTEPKIKLYVYSKADNLKEADQKINNMEEVIMGLLNSIE